MTVEKGSEVVIPLSRRKKVLLLVGSLGFVAAGIFTWTIAETQVELPPGFVRVIAVVCVLFFGLCAVYAAVKMFDTEPGLIIDSEGIVDNSSAVSAGRISWNEIVGYRVTEVMGNQRFITIEVVNPRKFIEQGSPIRQRMNAANTSMTGSPINISANLLRVDFETLHTLIADAFERYKAIGWRETRS